MKKSVLKQLLTAVYRIVLVISIIIGAIWVYVATPSLMSSPQIEQGVDMARLKLHVKTLSQDFHPRSFNNHSNLEASAEYIENQFRQSGGRVSIQEYEVTGTPYKNVRCLFGEGKERRIIIGAHYDSHSDTPGADDNASGVAGLIELAYLLNTASLDYEVELVAYTLEEPPYFGSNQMGSYRHAKLIHESNINVAGVIILEMIGYFSNEPNTQEYPIPVLKFIYPSKGNFISVVGKMDQRDFTKKIKVGMKGSTKLPVYSINAPVELPGIDFSDHRNYWAFNYNAVMITDTAFYRNKNYHKTTDTWDKLDYNSMSKVIRSVFSTILQFKSESL